MKTIYEVDTYYQNTADKQDPAFYIDGDGHTWAASVTRNERTIYVYADGEMRFTIDGETEVRHTGHLAELGITSDSALWELDKQGRAEWEHNAWFDLYDGDTGDHLDRVCHFLDEAITAAQHLLATAK